MALQHIATRRVQPDMLTQCVRSGQVDSRQIHEHAKAGELRLTEKDGGYECSLSQITFAGPEPRAPLPWGLIGWVSAGAACAMFAAIIVWG
jgi:hypothetical protein